MNMDLFGETPEAMPAKVPQPPVFARVGEEFPENELGLKPLRVINADWIEVKVTVDEFKAEKARYPADVSEHAVMLNMLVDRGIRITRMCLDKRTDYLADYLAGPCVLRRWTEPGFAVTCRQAPA